MPICETVLDLVAGFLLDMDPCPGDAVLGGRVIARLMVTQKVLRHDQIMERMKGWQLQHVRVMHAYWRGRALEAERRLTHTRRAIERARGLAVQERSLLIATVRDYDEFETDSESD
jgi:hypothetical protein